MVLALVLKVLTALALMLMILAQFYHVFTDGYLQSKKNDRLTDSLNNIGLRDASASKNVFEVVCLKPSLALCPHSLKRVDIHFGTLVKTLKLHC